MLSFSYSFRPDEVYSSRWKLVFNESTVLFHRKSTSSNVTTEWEIYTNSPTFYILFALFKGPFVVLYLCHLITYFCTKCREMLSKLFSVQTNWCKSFHHQSGVSLLPGTTFLELLLSLQIGNPMGKKTKVSLTWSLTKCKPDPKPHPWGIHLTRDQSDQSSNTRCLCWQYIWHKGVHLIKSQPDPKIWQKCQPDLKPHLQGVTSDKRSIWPK